MKITLDIPDTTSAAFFNFVCYRRGEVSNFMQCHSIGSDELYDGAEIEIKEAEVQKETQDD
jgi:hypothetical protein